MPSCSAARAAATVEPVACSERDASAGDHGRPEARRLAPVEQAVAHAPHPLRVVREQRVVPRDRRRLEDRHVRRPGERRPHEAVLRLREAVPLGEREAVAVVRVGPHREASAYPGRSSGSRGVRCSRPEAGPRFLRRRPHVPAGPPPSRRRVHRRVRADVHRRGRDHEREALRGLLADRHRRRARPGDRRDGVRVRPRLRRPLQPRRLDGHADHAPHEPDGVRRLRRRAVRRRHRRGAAPGGALRRGGQERDAPRRPGPRRRHVGGPGPGHRGGPDLLPGGRDLRRRGRSRRARSTRSPACPSAS